MLIYPRRQSNASPRGLQMQLAQGFAFHSGEMGLH